MKKRILAMLCALALLLSCVPTSIMATEEVPQTTYEVGYAKTDLNPWVDENDHSAGVHPIPLGGYGDAGNRLSMGITNDDGDLAQNDEEGVFATCIAVTDNQGKTVLFISHDLISTEKWLLDETRAAIQSAIADEPQLSDCNIDVETDVFINASHSHFSPDITTQESQLKNNVKTAKSDSLYNAYYNEQYDIIYDAQYDDLYNDYLWGEHFWDSTASKEAAIADIEALATAAADAKKSQFTSEATTYANYIWGLVAEYRESLPGKLAAAAVNALLDRAPAVSVSKSQIDAAAEVSAQAGVPVILNGVRHYINYGYSTSDYDSKTGYWVSGDNFGANQICSELYEPQDKPGYENVRGAGGTMSGNIVEKKAHVTDANSMLYLLEFAFEEKAPILLANWRSHPTLNGESITNADADAQNLILNNVNTYGETNGYNCISGDYPNAFRNLMAKEENGGYRVAFIQGASGNINSGSKANYGEFDTTKTDPYQDHLAEVVAGVSVKANAIPLKNIDVKKNNGDWNRMLRYGILPKIDGSGNYEKDAVPGNVYGELLAYAAKEALKEKTTCDTGPISTKRVDLDAGSNNFIFDEWTEENSALVLKAIDNTAGKGYPCGDKETGIVFNSSLHRSNMKKWAQGRGVIDGLETVLELNAISIGPDLAFVTAPGELYDNYDSSGSRDPNDNDWLELNALGYGTPFVLGVTNGHFKYIPNTLAYDYNTEDMLLSLGNSNAVATDYSTNKFGPGSYGANWSYLAKGTGEEIIANYKSMLISMSSSARSDNCPECGDGQTWVKLTQDNFGTQLVTGGHYYIEEEITLAKKLDIPANTTVCLDLNGQTITVTGDSRAFTVGGTLNLKDSQSNGMVVGNGTAAGGAIYIRGAMNLHGGTIKVNEGNVINNQQGGAIYVRANGSLNLHGGNVEDGRGAVGSCVYVESGANVLLSSGAEVADIYFAASQQANKFTVENFTGKASLTFEQSFTAGQAIGTINGSLGYNAELTVAYPAGLFVISEGNQLVLTDEEPVIPSAMIGDVVYSSVHEAIEKYNNEDHVIQLLRSDDELVTIPADKTVTIDLDGFNLKDVQANGTLYVKDSKTDDFDVKDGKYGKITGNIEGNVKALPLAYGDDLHPTKADGYLQVTEGDDVSFHRVYMDVTNMVMSASRVSAYFDCNFAGDEKVADLVDQFGMIISLQGTPNTIEQGKALTADCQRSWFNSFNAGQNTGSSTCLYNIMKPDNGYLANKVNSTTPIYFRTYIKLDDGTYVLGSDNKGGSTSLKKILEAVSQLMWQDLTPEQKDDVIDLYQSYTSVFNGWSIDNLRQASKEREDGTVSTDSTLKILTLGSSHSQDSMQMLYEVLEENKVNGKFLGKFDNVVLARIYYSGCSMNKHKQSIQNDDPIYTYHKNENGTWYQPLGVDTLTTMDYALTDEDWDIVVLQEYNVHAGLDRVYNDDRYQVVIDHVNEVCDDPILAFNMTWANPVADEVFTEYGDVADAPTARNMPASRTGDASKTFKDDYVDDYGLDQQLMYNKIVANTESKVMGVYDEISLLLPVATPVQYANDYLTLNGEEIGDLDLYRDYTHLNDFGRLMVATLWYAELDRFYNPDTASFDREDVSIDTIELALRFSNSSAYKYRYKVTEDWNLTVEEQDVIYAAVKHALENPYTTQANEE